MRALDDFLEGIKNKLVRVYVYISQIKLKLLVNNVVDKNSYLIVILYLLLIYISQFFYLQFIFILIFLEKEKKIAF